MSKNEKLRLKILRILSTHNLSINKLSKKIGISNATTRRILSSQFNLISAKMWKKVESAISNFDSVSVKKM